MGWRRSLWIRLGFVCAFLNCGWLGAGLVFMYSGFRGPMPQAWVNGTLVLISLAGILPMMGAVVHSWRRRRRSGRRDEKDVEPAV